MAGVFISYSAKDRAFVQRLYQALRAVDTPVWLDLEGIAPSVSWQDEVRSAIEAAEAFIFVLSPDSIVSKWCQSELEAALYLKKRIIPVVAREVSASEITRHSTFISGLISREPTASMRQRASSRSRWGQRRRG